MWPYFAVVIVILFLQIKINYRVAKLQFYIGIIVLFVFAACRGNGSGDYFAYLYYGWDIRTIQDVLYTHKNMEIGYRVIAFFINWLHLPGQAIIVSMNLISMACICTFIKKYSKDWCLSLLLFLPIFFQFDMHAARTAVAISISALCLKYTLEKKPIRFFVTLFFAMMFHSSAIIILPLYILPYIKIQLATGLMFILIDMLFVTIIGFDSLAIVLLDLFHLQRFKERYLEYAVVKADMYGYKFSLWDPRLLILIAVFVFAAVIIKKKGRFENVLINCCLANILLLILFSEHTALACRISSFYNVYLIILVPLIMTNIRERFALYKTRYIGLKNKLISRIGCIMFYGVYACAYIYVCFIAANVNYRLFFL